MRERDRAFSRKVFLKSGILVASAGLLGSVAAACGISSGRQRLLFFSGTEADVIRALAEIMFPPEAGFPTLEEARVVERLDEELYFTSEGIQSDFSAALLALQYLQLLTGWFARFTGLSPARRAAFLESMKLTQQDTFRAVVSNVRMLVCMVYYGHERSWPGIGYDGPFRGRGQIESETREYYRRLTEQ